MLPTIAVTATTLLAALALLGRHVRTASPTLAMRVARVSEPRGTRVVDRSR